jgi:hypothetical protein
MDNPVDGTDGKLGRGFMSADKLEEVDIGSGDKLTIRLQGGIDQVAQGI